MHARQKKPRRRGGGESSVELYGEMQRQEYPPYEVGVVG